MTIDEFLLRRTSATICHWDDPPRSGLSYSELDRRAGRVAETLSRQARPGDRILIGLPTSADFLVAFFGCLYAGAIPAAVAPPTGKRRTERLAPLIDVAEPVAMIGKGIDGDEVQGLPCLDLDDLEAGGGHLRLGAGAEDIAYLQFTSGSTSLPRAVMIRHSALLANVHSIAEAASLPNGATVLSWLPMHHDMGLVSSLFALCYGHGLVLERPEAFTRSPMRWLEAITRHRAAFSGAPNFAFDLLNRSRPAESAASLDLSSWQIAFCGAEPIRPTVLRRFAQRYAGAGFRPEMLMPAYGMAEFTLLVSTAERDAAPRSRVFGAGREVMSCGRAMAGTEVRIVDPKTRRPVDGGARGEIWVRGPSMGAGYWQDPAATSATFEGRLPGDDRPWLRTGDLGSMENGEIFVLGRLKDVLIVRGRNLHAEEVETVVAAAYPMLSPAIAAVMVETDRGEGVGLACELRKTLPRGLTPAEVFEAIQRELSAVFGIGADRIVLVRRGALPRTTSGKIRRADCRDRLADGSLAILHEWRPRAGAQAPEETEPWRDAARILDWMLCWIEINTGVVAQRSAPVEEIGIDSLTALELTHDLENWLRRPVSSTAVFEAASLSALAAGLAEWRAGATSMGEQGRIAGAFDLESRLSELEDLSDSEVGRLLASRMNFGPAE